MAQAPDPSKWPKEDPHHLAEIFADSLGQATFDGQTLRLEFCVARWDEVKAQTPPTGKRYVVARIALTPAAGAALINACTQMAAAMKKAGVVKETAPAPAAAPRN